MTKFRENRVNKREISSDKKIIVFYHKDCTDGFCGAWTAWRKFGDEAEYIAVDPGASAPDLNDKNIYTIDMCFSVEDSRRLIDDNRRLTTIDHHVTRKDIVPMTTDYSFDLGHSGCVLAWKYFHPNKSVPKLLLWVEDFDLWKFNLTGTNEIISFLDLYDFSFEIYDKLVEDFENKDRVAEYINTGKTLLEHEKMQVERIIKSGAMPAVFEGIRTYVVNSCLYGSRIGDRLWRILPPMGIIWSEESGKRYVSLRSNDTVDVSIMATKYGGGGHKMAAGFTLELDEKLPWEYIKR